MFVYWNALQFLKKEVTTPLIEERTSYHVCWNLASNLQAERWEFGNLKIGEWSCFENFCLFSELQMRLGATVNYLKCGTWQIWLITDLKALWRRKCVWALHTPDEEESELATSLLWNSLSKEYLSCKKLRSSYLLCILLFALIVQESVT